MIYLKRTFHPAGQGAFFTEQFYDASMERALYNVVYDCGSLSPGIKIQVERDIRNCFHKRKKIDALFLSHFDDDHVKYVRHLQDKNYLQGTRIFIPMIEEEKWLGLRPFAANYGFIMSLNQQSPGGIKVIQVEFESDRRNDNVPRVIEEIEGGRIASGIPLTPSGLAGVIWCYTPFNVRFSELINKFKKLLETDGLAYNQLQDADYVAKRIGRLKKVYKELGENPTNGTSINLNSLLVMSYPKNQANCSLIGYRRMDIDYLDWLIRSHDGYIGSCLYTGDTSANDPVVWRKINQMIDRCLGCDKKLMEIQVPHHGSKNNYDHNLIDSDRFLNGFTNYDPYYRQHIFDDDLPMKFASKGKPLLLVTRGYCSQAEEYYELR